MPEFKVGKAVSRPIRFYVLGASREKLRDLEFAKADALPGKGTGQSTGSMRLWGGLALLAVIIATLYYRRARSRPLQPGTPASGTSSLATGDSYSRKQHQQVLKQLHGRAIEACQANQPGAVCVALRAWYVEANPHMALTSPELPLQHAALASEFDALESRLYRAGFLQAWHSEHFLDTFKEMSSQTPKAENDWTAATSVPASDPARYDLQDFPHGSARLQINDGHFATRTKSHERPPGSGSL